MINPENLLHPTEFLAFKMKNKVWIARFLFIIFVKKWTSYWWHTFFFRQSINQKYYLVLREWTTLEKTFPILMLLLGEELYLFLQSFAFHVFFITNLRSNHNIFLSYLLQVLDYRNVKWIKFPFLGGKCFSDWSRKASKAKSLGRLRNVIC